jgi:hypothetical protein
MPGRVNDPSGATAPPSGPGRFPSSIAPNVVLQNSISAATSQHTTLVSSMMIHRYRFDSAHMFVGYVLQRQ